jgi:hypothetical protein
MDFLPAIDNPVFIVVAILVAIGIVALIFFVYKRGKQDREPELPVPEVLKRPIGNLDYRPRAPPVKEMLPPSPPQSAGTSSVTGTRVIEQAAPKEIELIKDRADITTSLLALIEKYSLEQFTLATTDGLVFASSGSETAQDDAAVSSGMYAKNPQERTPGITLFEMTHKNSGLIGIIRAKTTVSEKTLQKITTDTKDILNWWI